MKRQGGIPTLQNRSSAGFHLAADAFEVRAHVGRVLVPQLAILIESFHDDLFQLGRDIRVDLESGALARVR